MLFGDQLRLLKTSMAVSVAPSVTIMIILLQPVLSRKGCCSSLLVGARHRTNNCQSTMKILQGNRTIEIRGTECLSFCFGMVVIRKIMTLTENTSILRSRDVDPCRIQNIERHVQCFGEVSDLLGGNARIHRCPEFLEKSKCRFRSMSTEREREILC